MCFPAVRAPSHGAGPQRFPGGFEKTAARTAPVSTEPFPVLGFTRKCRTFKQMGQRSQRAKGKLICLDHCAALQLPGGPRKRRQAELASAPPGLRHVRGLVLPHPAWLGHADAKVLKGLRKTGPASRKRAALLSAAAGTSDPSEGVTCWTPAQGDGVLELPPQLSCPGL